MLNDEIIEPACSTQAVGLQIYYLKNQYMVSEINSFLFRNLSPLPEKVLHQAGTFFC